MWHPGQRVQKPPGHAPGEILLLSGGASVFSAVKKTSGEMIVKSPGVGVGESALFSGSSNTTNDQTGSWPSACPR